MKVKKMQIFAASLLLTLLTLFIRSNCSEGAALVYNTLDHSIAKLDRYYCVGRVGVQYFGFPLQAINWTDNSIEISYFGFLGNLLFWLAVVLVTVKIIPILKKGKNEV